MPFYIFSLKEEFKAQVIDKFIEFYEQGKTPNPCVECNKNINTKKETTECSNSCGEGVSYLIIKSIDKKTGKTVVSNIYQLSLPVGSGKSLCFEFLSLQAEIIAKYIPNYLTTRLQESYLCNVDKRMKLPVRKVTHNS